MIRTLILVVVVGFVLSILALVTAVAFAGGPGGIGNMMSALSHNKNLHWEFTSDDNPKSLHWSGPTVSRDFPWSGEDRLEIEDTADITYIQGPVAKLTIEAPATVLDTVRVEGGRIERDGNHNSRGVLKITLTAPKVHRFDLGGVQTLKISQFDQDDLDLNLSGASKVTGTGRVHDLSLDISGTGAADLADMQMETARVDLSGAGKARLGPKASAKVSISGIGEVELTRKPETLRSDISGLGRVSQPGLPD